MYLAVAFVTPNNTVQAFAADMEEPPTITFVGNTQPYEWNYAAPKDHAITWFAAEYNLPVTADVAFDSFTINPGMSPMNSL